MPCWCRLAFAIELHVATSIHWTKSAPLLYPCRLALVVAGIRPDHVSHSLVAGIRPDHVGHSLVAGIDPDHVGYSLVSGPRPRHIGQAVSLATCIAAALIGVRNDSLV